MKKKWIIIAIIVFVALSLIGVGIYWQSTNYVAKVSNEKISKPEFKFFLTSIKNQMENSGASIQEGSGNAIWNSKIDGKDAKLVAKDKALDEAKKYKIQLIKAKERNIKLDKNDNLRIEKAIKDEVQKSGGQVEAEKVFIEAYGVGVKDYTNIIKKLMLVYKFMQEEEKNIQVTEVEIQDGYKKNFENLEITTVRHILFSIMDENRQPLPEDKQLEAKNKADEIFKRAQQGEDFASLASEYSEDPGSKDNGGEYTFQKGQMVKEFEEWAFKAKPGDMGIVKSMFGYHIMNKPLQKDLKEKIKDSIVKDKYNKQLEQWTNKLKYDLKKNQKVFDQIQVI